MIRAAAVLVVALFAGAARADAPKPKAPELVGRWRVTGCATSPRDPAPCATGSISFSGTHWSVDLPCCKVEHDYKIVAADARTITLDSDGISSKITFDPKGRATWFPPGVGGGRVGDISFVRAPKP